MSTELGLITTADFILLSPDELTSLCNQLIAQELTRASVPVTASDATMRITVLDGGIDNWVEWEGGPSAIDFVPARLTGFQFKSGDLDADGAAAELLKKDGSDLKPMVRKLFRERRNIRFGGNPCGSDCSAKAKVDCGHGRANRSETRQGFLSNSNRRSLGFENSG